MQFDPRRRQQLLSSKSNVRNGRSSATPVPTRHSQPPASSASFIDPFESASAQNTLKSSVGAKKRPLADADISESISSSRLSPPSKRVRNDGKMSEKALGKQAAVGNSDSEESSGNEDAVSETSTVKYDNRQPGPSTSHSQLQGQYTPSAASNIKSLVDTVAGLQRGFEDLKKVPRENDKYLKMMSKKLDAAVENINKVAKRMDAIEETSKEMQGRMLSYEEKEGGETNDDTAWMSVNNTYMNDIMSLLRFFMRVCMMIPTHTAYKNYPEPVEEGFYLSIPENPNLLVLRPDWYAGWPINQAEWLDDFVTLFYRDAHLHATNPTFTHDFIQTIPVLVIEAKIHEQFNNALAQKRFSSKSESEKCEIMRKKRHHARRMEKSTARSVWRSESGEYQDKEYDAFFHPAHQSSDDSVRRYPLETSDDPEDPKDTDDDDKQDRPYITRNPGFWNNDGEEIRARIKSMTEKSLKAQKKDKANTRVSRDRVDQEHYFMELERPNVRQTFGKGRARIPRKYICDKYAARHPDVESPTRVRWDDLSDEENEPRLQAEVLKNAGTNAGGRDKLGSEDEEAEPADDEGTTVKVKKATKKRATAAKEPEPVVAAKKGKGKVAVRTKEQRRSKRLAEGVVAVSEPEGSSAGPSRIGEDAELDDGFEAGPGDDAIRNERAAQRREQEAREIEALMGYRLTPK